MTQQIHYIISLLGIISIATINIFLLLAFGAITIYLDGRRKKSLFVITVLMIGISVVVSATAIYTSNMSNPETREIETLVNVVPDIVEKAPIPSVIER